MCRETNSLAAGKGSFLWLTDVQKDRLCMTWHERSCRIKIIVRHVLEFFCVCYDPTARMLNVNVCLMNISGVLFCTCSFLICMKSLGIKDSFHNRLKAHI